METKIRILNAEPDSYSPKALSILQSFAEVDTNKLTRAELLKNIAIYDVLIVRLGFQIDEEVFSRAENLKVIVTATTGTDHIDVRAAERHGVALLCLKGETEFLRSIPATAELTWGLILALLRKIPNAIRSVSAGNWERERFRGYDLSGKKLGLLGAGRIGEKIARYGQAFEMQVMAYDIDPTKSIPGIVMKDSMAALLREAEILTIHIPLDSSTEGLLGEKEMSLLPEGAWLINTSRGGILDEQAVISALQSGHLSGAALDVIRGERNLSDKKSVLIEYAQSHDNLIITPHIGGATFDSMAATEVFMAEKLQKYFQNEIGE